MNKYQILVVDDDLKQVNSIADILEKTKFDVKTVIPDAAENMTNLNSFDLILIDMHFTKDGNDYGGQHFAFKVREKTKAPSIILYSGKFEPTKDGNQEKVKSYKNSVDDIVTREELASKTPDELNQFILSSIEKKRKEINNTVRLEIENNIRSLAAEEQISKTTIVKIVNALMPNSEKVELQALKTGFSGAIILRLRGNDRKTNQRLDIILKLSKGESSLELEVERKPIEGTNFNYHGVFPRDLTEVDGWSVTYMNYIPNAISLRKFLIEKRISITNKKIIQRIIDIIAIEPIKSLSAQKEENVLAVSNYSTALLIEEELDLIAKFSKKNYKQIAQSISLIKAYLNMVIEGRRKFKSTYFTKQHGDLHTENVLISSHDEIKIIDFGKSTVLPRLFDIAALDVDLVLNVIFVDSDEQFSFKKIDNWMEIALCSFPFEKKTKTVAVKKSLAIDFRNQLLLKLCNEVEDVTKNEYAEVLLFQYLRYLKFTAIPIPRRILAIKIIENLIKLLKLNFVDM